MELHYENDKLLAYLFLFFSNNFDKFSRITSQALWMFFWWLNTGKNLSHLLFQLQSLTWEQRSGEFDFVNY